MRRIEKGSWVLFYPGEILGKVQDVTKFRGDLAAITVLITDWQKNKDRFRFSTSKVISDNTAEIVCTSASIYKHSPDDDEIADFYAGMLE